MFFAFAKEKKNQASISDGNGAFSIFCLTKIMKTKPRKMRLELWVVGNRMKGDLEAPQVFKKKKKDIFQRGWTDGTGEARLPHPDVSLYKCRSA